MGPRSRCAPAPADPSTPGPKPTRCSGYGDGVYTHFQLDATASVPFFMAEMLLQSHLGEIHLLPSLPAEFESGSVTGLLARGGYEVDIEWAARQLQKATIRPGRGKVPRVRVGHDVVDPTTDARIEVVTAGGPR